MICPHLVLYRWVAAVALVLIFGEFSDARNQSTFFLVQLRTDHSTNVQVTCGAACKAEAHDAFVAWILSDAENDMVSSLFEQAAAPFSYYILGGNRRAPVTGALSGTIWYWTERPTQFIAQDTRGLPFYKNLNQKGGSLLGYAKFDVDEPNNLGGSETQLSFDASTGKWNDLNGNCSNFGNCYIKGCICRHWSTPSPTVSESQLSSDEPTWSISASTSMSSSASRTYSWTGAVSASITRRSVTLSASSLVSVTPSISTTCPTAPFPSLTPSIVISASQVSLSSSTTLSDKTISHNKTESIRSLSLSESACRNELGVEVFSLATAPVSTDARAIISNDLNRYRATVISSESSLCIVPDAVLRGVDASLAPLALIHTDARMWQVTPWILQHFFLPKELTGRLDIIARTNCGYQRTAPNDNNKTVGTNGAICTTVLSAAGSLNGSSRAASSATNRSALETVATGMTWMAILNPSNSLALSVSPVNVPFVCATQVQYVSLSLEIARSQSDVTSQTTAVVVTSSSFVTSGGDVSGAVPMLFLSMLSCRDTVDSAQTAVQTLVSPFASLGVMWVAWGNLGLSVAIVLIHCIVTVTLAKFRGVSILQDAAVIAKFPGLSITAMDYLLPGSILGSVAVLASRETAAESIASASVALTCALLIVVGLSAATVGYVLPRASWEAYLRVPLLTTLTHLPAGTSSGTTTTACEQRCCAPYEHYFYPRGRWAPVSLRARFTPLMGWMGFKFGWVTIFQRCLLCTLAAATSLSGRPALCNAIVLFLAAAHLMTMLFYLWYRPLRYPMNTIIFPLSSALFAIVFILKYLDAFEDVSSVLQAVNGVAQFWRSCWVLWISRREAQWDTEDNIVNHRFIVRRLNKGEEEGSSADMSMMIAEQEIISCGNSQEMSLRNFAELTSPFIVHTTQFLDDDGLLLRPDQPPENVGNASPGSGSVVVNNESVIWSHGRLVPPRTNAASEFALPTLRVEQRARGLHDHDTFHSLQDSYDEGPLPFSSPLFGCRL
ncbi:membrane-associated protein, putative [Bodo saltans]|uniref:Membrane-associated protein, putative n=1 Tax=Bodo saltans TaxID=75058 RepID=A0A0S4J7Y1_BODSA|nr:membrane-associated protein, putative [Bodo saltans]|eukprot:CUG86604.1 membrane-associated protein, putative [Bodo saltans]